MTAPTARAVPEWIGATPDSAVPDRVKLRVFQRHEGRCYLTGRKILPGDQWDAEHVIAIINGGENRESNLAPALRSAHRAKTAEDVATKSKTYRMAKKHLGLGKPKSRGFGPRSRKFNGEIGLTARARRQEGQSNA